MKNVSCIPDQTPAAISGIGVDDGVLPPLSVKDARKVLGKSYNDVDDSVIESMVYNLTAIARSYIKQSSRT